MHVVETRSCATDKNVTDVLIIAFENKCAGAISHNELQLPLNNELSYVSELLYGMYQVRRSTCRSFISTNSLTTKQNLGRDLSLVNK